MTKNQLSLTLVLLMRIVLKEFFEKNSPISAEKYIPHNEVTFK